MFIYKECPTCEDHALPQALLEAAVLAPVTLSLVDFAVAIRHTSVHSFILHCALEKSFASDSSPESGDVHGKGGGKGVGSEVSDVRRRDRWTGEGKRVKKPGEEEEGRKIQTKKPR